MRPEWSTLPPPVVAGAEAVLGFRVVESISQTAGFSPGVAARVRGSQGQRAFKKAVSSLVNAESPTLHRDEARYAPLLPLGSPRLLGSYDEGTWVALVFEEVDGHQPGVPWTPAELEAAIDVLDQQARVAAPPQLPSVAESLRSELGGFALLSANPIGVNGWELRHLEGQAALEAGWQQAAAGDRWLHNDARGDNMLIRPDGTAVLVDWPWSCAGNPAFDAVGFVPTAIRDGAGRPGLGVGEACEELFGRLAGSRCATDDQITAMVAAFAGLMQHRRRQPAPPGIPGVRAFQASQGDVAMAWLRLRTGWA
jgi:hypothetical protein